MCEILLNLKEMYNKFIRHNKHNKLIKNTDDIEDHYEIEHLVNLKSY